MEKIGTEQATKEFSKWLDFKKISNPKRESLKDVQDEIVDAICDGILTIDPETFEITYTLKFPPESTSIDFDENLVFKPRVSLGVINSKLKGVAASDINGRIVAYASAVTGQNNSYFRVLDTVDFSIVSDIVSYFF